MDFRTCPSCQQSVLDDDVENCPFCGASMTGKPTPKPPQTTGQSPAGAKKASAQKSTAKSTSAASSREAQPDDDPFQVDDTAAKQAIPLARKPAKGRTYRVVCPMCETQGFVSRRAAGKDVKCANPKCLVPIFTAPEIEKPDKEEVSQEPTRRGLSTGMLGAITGIALVLIGVGIWVFVLKTPDDDKFNQPTLDVANYNPDSMGQQDDPSENPSENPAEGQPDSEIPEAPAKQPTLAEIRQQILQNLVGVSRQQDGNRSKPLCRLLAAEACAKINELEAAETHLKGLRRVGRSIPFFQVRPLAAIAWQQLKSGDATTSAETIKQAREAAQRLPQVGREALDSATALAVALVAAGQTAPARDLMNKHHDGGERGQLSALIALAQAKGTFDIDSHVTHGLLAPVSSPQWVATTVGVAAQENWDAALAWAEQAPDPETRTESLIAWAEMLARQATGAEPAQPLDRLNDIAEKLTEAGRARMRARVAAVLWQSGDRAGAEENFAQAQAAYEKLAPASVYPIPSPQAIHDLRTEDPVPSRLAALAGGELARIATQLQGPEIGWPILDRALDFARASGPALPALERRLAQLENGGDRDIRSELKRSLALNSDDQARLALIRYRRNLDSLLQLAQQRFELQQALLIRGAEAGLFEPIWNEMQSHTSQEDENLQEPYLRTALPRIVALQAQQSGNESLAQTIQNQLGQESARTSVANLALHLALNQAVNGNAQQAAAVVERERGRLSRHLRTQWVMQVASRFVSQEQIAPALKFVSLIDGSRDYIREETLALVAAQASRQGKAGEVWNFVNQQKLTPTETIAIYHGLLVGMESAAISSPAAGTAASSESSSVPSAAP